MYENEINKRRTFAIISHPDAGYGQACGLRLDGDREGERYIGNLIRAAV